MADQGTGVSVTWDTGYLATMTAGTLRVNRQEIDITTLATTGGKLWDRSDLYEAEMDVEWLFAPGTSPGVIDGDAAGNCTVTFSDSGGATWATTAFMRDIAVNIGLDDRVRGSGTLRFSGNVTVTP
jgi:hypothetical protein